jgi:hypothetical protein
VIFRFQTTANLTVLKAEDGYLEFYEVYLDDNQELQYVCTSNEGMKCRCNLNTKDLIGTALAQCYGQAVQGKKCFESITSVSCRKFGRDEDIPPSETMTFFSESTKSETTIADFAKNIGKLQSSSMPADQLHSARLILKNFLAGKCVPRAVDPRHTAYSLLCEDESTSEDIITFKALMGSLFSKISEPLNILE